MCVIICIFVFLLFICFKYNRIQIGGSNNPNGSPLTECGEFWYQSNSDKMWRDLDCDNANVVTHAFVCNRPNICDVYEYENYIGVEAEIWGVTWDEASIFCEQEFAISTTLPSSHSSDEQNEIRIVRITGVCVCVRNLALFAYLLDC